MIESGDRPLVTFALFSYNHEKYIREAVESILEQDYSPLEIILSDDCSSDNAFRIMSEIVECYQGKHRVILRQNKINLGLSEHINAINSIASGELLVISAGDDISDSNRASVLVSEWVKNGKKAVSIFSGMREIDINSKVTGKIYQSKLDWNSLIPRDFISKNIGVFGASHAWSMEVMDKFTDIHPKVINEDNVIPFRASLLSGVLYIDEILVSYRANIGLASQYSNGNFPVNRIRRSASILRRPYVAYVQKMADIKWLGDYDKSLLKLAQSRRADHLFRYWLVANRNFSRQRICYFLRRCRTAWILREIILLFRRD